PAFDRIQPKLKQLFTILGYKIQDSETDADFKAKAASLKLARLIAYSDLNYEGTDVDYGVHFYLFTDGTYDVAITNKVAENDKANAPHVYVPQKVYKYDFTQAPNLWNAYNNKW